jgi:hypothetical protein
VILPNGHYTICYSNKTNDTVTDIIHNEHDITMPSNIELNLTNGVTISAMFDSDTTATSGAVIRNPHDIGSYAPRDIQGNFFSFSRCHNSKIVGGTMIGVMPQRSFVDPDEEDTEFTYGVFIHRGSSKCRVLGTKFVGFTGDGVSGSSTHDPDLGEQLPYDEARTFYKGLLSKVDGTVDTGIDTAYTTNLVPLTNIDQTKGDQIILRTNIGFTRIPDLENQRLILAWYDNSDVFIESEDFKYLQLAKIPLNASKIRLCCMGEASGPASVTKIFQITPPSPYDFVISGCHITQCHRGGISNMVNDTIIEFNNIYNNGLGWREGYPLFGGGSEGTRYGANGEDVVARKVTIRNNTIDNTNHGILMSGLVVDILNNNISNCDGNGIVLYYIETATVSSNVFTNCNASVGFIESTLKRHISIINNKSYNCGFSDVSQEAYLNTDSTVFTAYGNYCYSYNIMYKPHLDHLENFVVGNHIHEEAPNLHNLNIDKFYIRGKYPNAKYDLTQSQFSTNRVYVNTVKGSDITINCTDKDRLITPEGNMYGLKINGGTLYEFLNATLTTETNFYGEGAVLNLDQIEFPQYGEPSSDHTQNYYDFTFKIKGGYDNFFYMMNNNAGGTAVLTQNFYNCKFLVESGIGGTFFYYQYDGANQNVNVNIYYGEIDTTRTAETVYLGGRYPGYTNLVQLTRTGVTIKGALDETDVGFNIITV